MQFQSRGAWGCVLLGDPRFYEKLGFKLCPDFVSTQFPEAKALALAFFDSKIPQGGFSYHKSFIPDDTWHVDT